MAAENPRVAVVGSGISGLTLALALRQRGIAVTVFERAGELREVGAAVALAGNSTRLLDRLGLGGPLSAVSMEPTELVFRDWRDGRRMSAHPIGAGHAYRNRFGAAFYGLHRSDLLEILADAWGRDRIRMGCPVTGLRETCDAVTLGFDDGSEFPADLVVGADGVHSTVRRFVTTEDGPVYTGTSGFRGLVPLAAVPLLPDPLGLQFWMGPGAHVLHYAIGDGRVNFLAVLDGPQTWPAGASSIPAAPDDLATRFADWHPAVRQLLAAVPQSPRWALLSQPPLRHWSRGRAVLIGDAAHAMLPHQGQGANQAIEDAVVLADCLAAAPPGGHRYAFDRYQRLRRSRTRAIQRSSWDTSPLLHLPDGPAAVARNRDLDRFPDRFGWIHEHDAQASHPTNNTRSAHGRLRRNLVQ